MNDNLCIHAIIETTYGPRLFIIHDTDEVSVKAMVGFVRIVAMYDEPIITHEMVTSNGRFSCE